MPCANVSEKVTQCHLDSAFLTALLTRAQVEKERIETELRTAIGITDGHNHLIAAVVLITAGYAANGKYSHYLLVQSPITLADTLHLPSGSYVLGWTRNEEGLLVHCFEAATGTERGVVTATSPNPPSTSNPSASAPPPKAATSKSAASRCLSSPTKRRQR